MLAKPRQQRLVAADEVVTPDLRAAGAACQQTQPVRSAFAPREVEADDGDGGGAGHVGGGLENHLPRPGTYFAPPVERKPFGVSATVGSGKGSVSGTTRTSVVTFNGAGPPSR